jgi:hypothetical protein
MKSICDDFLFQFVMVDGAIVIELLPILISSGTHQYSMMKYYILSHICYIYDARFKCHPRNIIDI